MACVKHLRAVQVLASSLSTSLGHSLHVEWGRPGG